MKSIFTGKSRLYLITDRNISGLSHTTAVKQAISAGIGIVQLREKDLPKKEIFREAAAIRTLTRKSKIKFIINDHVDIALAIGADGVHLGQDDLPIYDARKILGREKIIGISTRTLKQAIDAESSGADYIGFGPVFSTSTKMTVRPKGLKALNDIRRHIKIPVVAIGGIKSDDVPGILGAGADAFAVASGVLIGDIRINIMRYFSVQDIDLPCSNQR